LLLQTALRLQQTWWSNSDRGECRLKQDTKASFHETLSFLSPSLFRLMLHYRAIHFHVLRARYAPPMAEFLVPGRQAVDLHSVSPGGWWLEIPPL